MTAMERLWAGMARLWSGATDTSALQAAEDRTHEATKDTHAPLSKASRENDQEAASLYLADRLSRAYPTGERALLLMGRFPGRDFDDEFDSARHALNDALNAEWKDGLAFGRWVERAAHRILLK